MKTVFAALVGSCWAFNIVAPAFLPHYHSSLIVNAPMMLVLGVLWSNKKRGDDK